MLYRSLILGALALWLLLVIAGVGAALGDGPSLAAEDIPETWEPTEAAWELVEPVPETEAATQETVGPTEPFVETQPEETAAALETGPYSEPIPEAAAAQIPIQAAVSPEPEPMSIAETIPIVVETVAETVSETEPQEEPLTGLNPMETGMSVIRRCWLYTPANPTENMPLIVYLHGGSGKGDDLNLITSVDGFPSYLQSGSFGDLRSYVLIPQLPAEQRGWAEVSEEVYALIASVADKYHIDWGNISLTGHSMGGTGAWSLAAAYPSLFARVAPLSGSVRSPESTAQSLQGTKVWAFVGSEDTIVPPESSEQTIDCLSELTDQAKLTIFDGADHFSVPSLAYLDGSMNLIGWLLGG